MCQRFTDVVNRADDGERSAIRALQAWQYLIGRASNRQIARYDDLPELMEYADNRPLGRILGCIMFYCQQNNLPPLTIIVVNQSGVPGQGFTAEALENYHQRREDVFNYPWHRIVPPSVAEFREASVKGQQSEPGVGAASA